MCFSVVFCVRSSMGKEQTRKVARVAMHAKSLTKGAYFFLEGRGRPFF